MKRTADNVVKAKGETFMKDEMPLRANQSWVARELHQQIAEIPMDHALEIDIGNRTHNSVAGSLTSYISSLGQTQRGWRVMRRNGRVFVVRYAAAE